MRISHKHKFVFIMVPKTGSTSVRKKLDPYSDIKSNSGNPPYNWHGSADELKKHYNNKNWAWDDYYKFTFVRNPWSRLVSEFCWRSTHWKGMPHTLKEYLTMVDELPITFDRDGSGPEGAKIHLLPQVSFIYDNNGTQLLDYVGHTETLQDNFNTVCDKIGIPRQQLPHRNKTKHKHYTEYYDDETRELVAEKYAKDIEYFGYKFGE